MIRRRSFILRHNSQFPPHSSTTHLSVLNNTHSINLHRSSDPSVQSSLCRELHPTATMSFQEKAQHQISQIDKEVREHMSGNRRNSVGFWIVHHLPGDNGSLKLPLVISAAN